MPRVRPLVTDPYLIRKRNVKADICSNMEKAGLSRTRLAKLTGVPYSSLCERLRDVSKMRLEEYWKIMDICQKEINRDERLCGSSNSYFG